MKFRDKVILIETLHEEAVDIAKEAFSIIIFSVFYPHCHILLLCA